MVWSIKTGDVIELPKDVYRYIVKDVYRDWAFLENQLTHDKKDVRISDIKNTAKIVKRSD